MFLIRNSSVVYYVTCDAQVRLSDALLFYFLSHLLPSRWAESAVGAGKVFGRAEDGQSCFVSGGITPTCTAQQTVKEKKHSKNSFFSLRSFHVFLEFFFYFFKSFRNFSEDDGRLNTERHKRQRRNSQLLQKGELCN